jgi:hypothetical protein
MIKYLTLLLCICILACCKKDLNYIYAFSLNGIAEQGNNYSATYHYDTTAALQEFAANFYIANVTDTNYVQISFSGNNYITPGTYYSGIINPGNTMCSFAYNNKHKYYTNVSGILQITQIDTNLRILKGNFQFKAVNTQSPFDTAVVSNGGFAAVKYLIQ